MTTLAKDVEFLSKNRLMDYSLLLVKLKKNKIETEETDASMNNVTIKHMLSVHNQVEEDKHPIPIPRMTEMNNLRTIYLKDLEYEKW